MHSLHMSSGTMCASACVSGCGLCCRMPLPCGLHCRPPSHAWRSCLTRLAHPTLLAHHVQCYQLTLLSDLTGKGPAQSPLRQHGSNCSMHAWSVMEVGSYSTCQTRWSFRITAGLSLQVAGKIRASSWLNKAQLRLGAEPCTP